MIFGLMFIGIGIAIKMLFSCLRKIVSNVVNGRRETESVPIYPECWVEVHKDHLNVMNRQIIKRSDITRFWWMTELM